MRLLADRYICSQTFLHNPPGSDNTLSHAPEEIIHEEHRLSHEDPEMNQWVCIAALAVIVGVMAATAKWVS
jgi:Ca2+:H+ antiporter